MDFSVGKLQMQIHVYTINCSLTLLISHIIYIVLFILFFALHCFLFPVFLFNLFCIVLVLFLEDVYVTIARKLENEIDIKPH